MDLESFKSKNGLNVLFIKSPSATASTVQMWFRAGSALESKRDQGVAHFLEHMFFKGTKKRPGAKVAKEVESFGGEINAFTSFDFTCYYINAPKSKISKATEILLDMTGNPTFLEKELVPERGVVLEEYNRSVDSPSGHAFSELQNHFFSSGFSHQILGTRKTIQNFSRDQISEFRNKHYTNENALLVIAGDDKELEKTKKVINSFSLPKGKKNSFKPFKINTKNRFQSHQKDVAMSTLTICLDSSSYESTQGPAEDLWMGILGLGETSRLTHPLVHEKQCANSASASTLFTTSGGIHFIKFNFESEKIDQLLKEVESIFNNLKKNPFSAEEIEKIKFQSISSKIYEKETIESFAFSHGHGFAQDGNHHSDEEFIQRINEVSDEELSKAGEDILSRDWCYQLQTPKGVDDKKLLEKVKILDKKLKKKANKSKAKKIKVEKGLSKFDSNLKTEEIRPGIHLLYRQNSLTQTFTLQTYLKGGLGQEKAETQGTYYFLSNLLNSSTKKTDRNESKLFFEKNAASLSNFTGKNAFGLTLSGLKQNFSELAEKKLEHLLQPKFSKEELEFEKMMALRTLEVQTEDPVRQCFDQVARSAFIGHPYSYKNMGTPKTIKKISLKSIKDLYKEKISNEAILFTYCGGHSFDEVKDLLLKETKNLQKRKPLAKTKLNKIQKAKNNYQHIEFEREQTHLFIGFQSPSMKSKENNILKILHTHLNGQSSILFTKVRDEMGLCYSVQPVHFSALEGGYFGIYIGCGNDKLESSHVEISKILNDLKNNGLSKKEFNTTKEMIIGQFELSLQTNEDYANIYSVPFLHGEKVDFYYNQNEEIKKLTYESFQKELKKILSRSQFKVTSGKKLHL